MIIFTIDEIDDLDRAATNLDMADYLGNSQEVAKVAGKLREAWDLANDHWLGRVKSEPVFISIGFDVPDRKTREMEVDER